MFVLTESKTLLNISNAHELWVEACPWEPLPDDGPEDFGKPIRWRVMAFYRSTVFSPEHGQNQEKQVLQSFGSKEEAQAYLEKLAKHLYAFRGVR